MQALIKFEMSAPQKINRYYFGMLLGLNRYLAINPIIIPRMMFVTADTMEAEIWSPFVMRTLLETELQKVPIVASV